MEKRKQHISDYGRLLHDQQERLKELACINSTVSILREGKPVEESLQQIVLLLPQAWQYPEHTVARITFRGNEFRTPGFKITEWGMPQDFTTIDDEAGNIEVYYTSQFREEDEGPFLKEERDLIRNIANILTGYINSYKARDLIRPRYEEADSADIKGSKLLQRFLDRNNSERDLFHDLMPFKVKEILLIANLYDAYSIEGEGRFSDLIMGDYYQMSLASVPRVTGVSGEEEALARLKARHYDLIIIMIGVDKKNPLSLCKKIKEKYPYLTCYLLLNNPCDAPYIKKQKALGVPFDNYFVWTGESNVFFAMVNLLEDRVNADNDTRKGLIKIILLVEDSARYYSSYLPSLYKLVMEQTRNLIEDVSSDELHKVVKLKTRPKVLLASEFGDAVSIIRRYRESLLCVITDMRFPKDGVIDEKAGYELISFVKKEIPGLPAVLQSSDPDNAKYAHALKSSFINKNSATLLQDIKSFITYYLGFGHFVYRDYKGGQIAVAKSMQEFESILQTVPEESLLYHAMKNHFSLWLMARGEVNIARMISPMSVSDFSSLQEMREFLVKTIRERRREINRGKVVNFEESAVIDDTNVVSLAGGSLGGKGRGLAFINTVINSFGIGRLLPGLNLKTPPTLIIGTDEFDMFMDRNHLWEKIKSGVTYDVLQHLFINGGLSYTLEKRLRFLIRQLQIPLAVRSSSLFEDSMNQPFSGIFGTWILPNNDADTECRLKQLMMAIKLVFFSVYSDNARRYFDSIGYRIEQEKMAVVIQPVAGNRYGTVFYPHISGTAQSFNYYPVAHMKPEDGFSVIALGLGQYVMNGEMAFRFSPAFPKVDVMSQEDIYRNTQVSFYAVNLANSRPDLVKGEDAGLIRLDISEAEKHGTLTHCASVLDPQNDVILPGLDKAGPRVVNFADILKYDFIPLAATIRQVLDLVSEAIGTPVEIEFAVDLRRDVNGDASFYLVQIKPLVGSIGNYTIDAESIKDDDLLLMTEKSMGNGLIENIRDIIYTEPHAFSSRHSAEMARELGEMNEKMKLRHRQYVLIGPGRWGTRDHNIGIPVEWPAISNARVIVEMNIPGIHLDPSLGSHFFHNVTSMNIGYLTVKDDVAGAVVKWDKIRNQEITGTGKYFRHISFEKPLVIRMDGRKGIAVITLNNQKT